ncbi:hypothetical protein F0562_034187 [Nyssa sinensis]|uniref:Uncharacterized protein n=1 Tax=Nyssa sinensis TaxID=561372 RepID=A0A5J5AFE7_9ASTE|nr:hypothetical protein F0562_034187 [Nyssa sinensis]
MTASPLSKLVPTVNCLKLLCNPIPGELNKFIPYELDDVRDLLMVIQVTFFDCGGMAVSLGVSHKVADALSFFMFLNCWAATARGDTDLPCPQFESATLFPPVNFTDFKPSTGIVKEKIMTKRFVFTASKISAIRDKYSDNTSADYPRRPTRIEALSAFIWSRFMASTQAKLSDSNKIYTVLHAVNLRTRMDPPLPEYYFGNISRLAIAVPSMDCADKEDCYGIVKSMRDEIRKVNGDYVKALRQGDKHLNFIKNRTESVTKGEIISFSFTSLCRFPLYEADFGWGKPVWVGSASLKFKNLVVFMDTPLGDEIEAWVNLKGEDMAKFEVDKELVAFVSPTPGPRISAPVFMPIVLFYPVDFDFKHDNENRSNQLKQSLSESLTRFYPLAGRMKDNLFIDCNDEGVLFLKAHVKCQLSEVVEQPEPANLNKLLPCELDNVGDLVLAIQVNSFDCGGTAVGLCISHKIADALSMFMFINSWAATARGDSDIVSPHFGLATLFPPRKLTGFKASTGIFKDKIVTKRFVFNSSKIASLRAKYTDSKGEKGGRPTRIEALSTFIWSRFVAATQEEEEEAGRLNTVLHAVNLRTRMDPPLPEHYFGNISSFAIAVPSMDSKEECYGVVNSVRDAIKRINGDYVKKLQRAGDEHLNFMKDRAEKVTKGGVVSFSFTSLCRFPLYEADFGWGKPIWVGSASLTFKNLVVFMDTKQGGGIEAWVNLKEDDMAKFQSDKEFLEHVLPNQDAKNSLF